MGPLTGLPESLIRTESGGNFQARNNISGSGGRGHFGRGQFSRGRLQDAERAGVIPRGTTPEQFLADPNMQQRVEAWHTQDIMNRIEREGLTRFIGQKIAGTEVTPEGMLAVAHLGGFGGLRRFLESGGQHNPSDAFGTSLASYLRTHGQAAGGRISPQMGGPQTGNALAMGESLPNRDMPENALAQRQEQARMNALAMATQRAPFEMPMIEAQPMESPQFAFQPMQVAPVEFRPRSVRRQS